MDKFHGKYRIPSSRLVGWDYSSNVAYFVTLCTALREHDFGEVIDGQMVLNPLGQAASDCWNAIPTHFPFVTLEGWVVMPNHVHGIVIIDRPHNLSDPSTPNRFGRQSQNLGAIIRGYKIGVTLFAHKQRLPFAWQPRYHDHIIRNQSEYDRVRKYIAENPLRWADDKFNLP